MELEDGIKKINGIASVEIEGFFTERFINLCKIRNVKIWNVNTIVNGIVRFDIATCDFKKLKEIEEKTKCKVTILKEKGVMPSIKKYKKRTLGVIVLILSVFLFIISNTFIWNIEVVGNEDISTEQIVESLKKNNFYVGKNKLTLKNKKVITGIRVDIPDISWAGIEYEGTTARVKIVERTSLPDYARIENKNGDIISNKSGMIKKIVVENGTAFKNVGDYVNQGDIIIQGKIYSDFLEEKDVTAKGTIILDTFYEYNEKLNYSRKIDKCVGKKKYSIGITLNNKEYYINYLDKSAKYDIIKDSWNIKILNFEISFDFYTFQKKEEVDISYSKEDLVNEVSTNSNKYIVDEILPTLKNPIVITRDIIIQDEDENSINFRVVYNVNEEVGEFIERE